jgi:hypothetical protein
MISSEKIISVERLSKRYWIGHRAAIRASPAALREVLARSVCGLARKTADVVCPQLTSGGMPRPTLFFRRRPVLDRRSYRGPTTIIR